MSGPRVQALLDELEQHRNEFVRAVSAVRDPTVSVLETWNVRDLVVHCAFWSGHGADALALAMAGRGAEFAYDKADTDAMNAATALAGREISLADALAREAGEYEGFRGALAALGDDRLDEMLGNGDCVEDVIRYDGPDHYAEHAAHLRNAVR